MRVLFGATTLLGILETSLFQLNFFFPPFLLKSDVFLLTNKNSFKLKPLEAVNSNVIKHQDKFGWPTTIKALL